MKIDKMIKPNYDKLYKCDWCNMVYPPGGYDYYTIRLFIDDIHTICADCYNHMILISSDDQLKYKKEKSKYDKPDWAIKQIIRSSGLIEDVCKHGIGHPNKQWLAQHDSKGDKGLSRHGCDGCCIKKKE